MSLLTLGRANRIINAAFEKAEQKGYKPLACIVLDEGGTVRAFKSQDGTSNGRFDVARGKANGALAVGTGSRWLDAQAASRPHFLAGLASVIDGGLVPVAGGVLARDANGRIVAAVGISGDTSDADEECAAYAIEAADLKADTGA